ncbi:MAG: GNAT family N-acetyltransferase [Ardenticatenaceae bacterium]|nr:GNAT family N-acetyltransferase [Anaerolineales bacterium]MCB8941932.1 GNAT family N-acetyltransferase [Ardenticatenaceae bacterium]MCB8973045.1 GNAT family N-acetyltransferase [Ardenticatenaceae bacterium]
MREGREIRPLQTESEWDDYTTLSMNAYPGIRATDEAARRRFKERGQELHADPIISVVGLFEAGEMRGTMRLYDFTMRLHGTDLLVGGVGGVAVDLLHKKERIAYDLVQYFQQHYRDKGAALTALYPFRPDFYKQMGYGYGRKINQYRVHPSSLPKGNRQNVIFLDESHRQAFEACYARLMAGSNGLMNQPESTLNMLFSPASTLKKVGYWADGQLQGYLLFSFEPVPNGTFLRNNIVVRTLLYENSAALRGLLAFLRAQADQIETVIFNTQDEDFHLLLHDPRNGTQNLMPSVYHESNTQGVGIMYRVIDVPRLFAQLAGHNFGGQTLTVQLNLRDSFWPDCAGVWVLQGGNGRITLDPAAKPDVAIGLDVAEFSSLFIGATSFRQLLAYGLADISDPAYADAVQALFYTANKPICHTAF